MTNRLECFAIGARQTFCDENDRLSLPTQTRRMKIARSLTSIYVEFLLISNLFVMMLSAMKKNVIETKEYRRYEW